MFYNKNKKLIILILVNALLVFCITTPRPVMAQPDIKAPSGILVDADTGTVLFEKNPHEKLEPASITKIMTLLISLEAVESGKFKLTDVVKVSERAWKTGGSQVFLGPGEEQTLETLLKCITVASGNDASVAVAEYIGGSVEGFTKMMNDKAKELGMKNTNFTNSHGLSDPELYTTAYDISLMARELVKYPLFFRWSTIWMDYLEHTDKKRDATMLANTNKLLGKYDGLDGIKTGFHAKAGHCFVGTAKRGDLRLVSVILNSQDTNERFEDTKKLLDYGFGHYSAVQVARKGEVQKTLPVEKGQRKEVNIIIPEDFSVLVEKGKEDGIKTKAELPEKLFAPIKKGQTVGTYFIEKDGKFYKQIDLVAEEDIAKASFLDMFKKVLGKWFSF